MILQLALLFAFLAVGELIVSLTHIPVPSCIIGMLLLTLALQLKIVKLRHIEEASGLLIRNLGFFFIPPGVSLMLHFGLIKAQWFPIVVASVVSTIVVLAVTGLVHQVVRRRVARNG